MSTSLSVRGGVVLGVLLLFAASAATGQQAPGGEQPPQAATESVDSLLSGFAEDEEGKKAGEGDGKDVPADLESGFQGDPTEGAAEARADGGEAPSIFSLDGFVRLDSAYNYAHDAPQAGQTDFRGLSKLRLALQLEVSLDFSADWKAFISGQVNRDFAYQLRNTTYTPEVLDVYEQETEFRDVYLQGSLSDAVDLKLGRQIVVWGKSDNIRVTDVLNPVDNRQPGLVDIEDIRLPVTMSRLDVYFGSWDLTAIAIHEVRFNKDPVIGSDFFPPSPQPLPPEQVPEDGGDNTEYALALSGIFSGYDLAFYYARIFDDTARLSSTTGELRHSRLDMVGVAFNIALGNWLLKSEAALFDGLEFFNLPGREFKRVDLLLGFEYVPFPDNTIAFEAVDRRLLDFEPILEDPPDSALEDINQYAISYRADLLRQRLHVVLFALFFGREAGNGSVRRYSATYDLFDAFSLTGGVVTYHAGNFLLDAARDNDRVFFEAKYSF